MVVTRVDEAMVAYVTGKRCDHTTSNIAYASPFRRWQCRSRVIEVLNVMHSGERSAWGY